jgi:propionyl-CoA carboxylase beta chain
LNRDFPELEKKRSDHHVGGGAMKQQERKKKGRITALERIELICDPESLTEIDPFVIHECHNFEMQDRKFLGEGVVTGFGAIDDHMGYVFSHEVAL